MTGENLGSTEKAPHSLLLACLQIKRLREPQAHRSCLETRYESSKMPKRTILRGSRRSHQPGARSTSRRTLSTETISGSNLQEALAERAQHGVRVRLLYDWLGSFSFSLRGRWPMLARAGVEEVRGAAIRRGSTGPLDGSAETIGKVITIDGRVAFVSGLCVGHRWIGDPERHVEPWRDTGVVIEGPAVADVEQAFAETWAIAGVPLPATDLPDRASIPAVGTVMARVVASTPTTAQLYRLDQLIAAGARRSLWLTDAYFIGTTLYVEA